MIWNYFKIAWRTFWKNRTTSLVNVLGLAMGLVVTLLIVLYVAHEYSYDRFHANGRRIVKVELRHEEGERSYSAPTMSFRFGETVKAACPGVDDFARLTEKGFNSKLIQSDADHKAFESDFRFADPGFLRLFSFQLLKGDPKTVLTRPATVVLTERMARKYFGDTDPLGKTILYDKAHRLQVVGVVKNPPFNSSIQFDFLGDMTTHRAIERNWHAGFLGEKKADEIQESVGTGGSYETYFLLSARTTTHDIEQKIPSLLSKEERIKDGRDRYRLYPLFDYHFRFQNLTYKRVGIFSVVGGLILLLALINYVSLTTARSVIRAKEIGVRKVVGAARKALVVQFYLESALYVTLAFCFAMLIFTVLQPVFCNTLQITIDPNFLTSPFFLIPTAGFFILSILLSGSYPALLLSGFSPIQSLKGKFSAAGSALWIRKGLTVFQFTVSIALMIGSILIKNQLDLFLQKDLGIDRDRVVTVHLDPEDGLDKYSKAIRAEINQLKGVESVAASTLLMYGPYSSSWQLKRMDGKKEVIATTYTVDAEFIETMNIKWAIAPRKGLNWTTSNQIVLNESAAKQLGVNQKNYEQSLDLGRGMTKTVVGVVKDFNFMTMAYGIAPMALFVGSDTTFRDYLYIKLAKGAPTSETLASIQQVYDRYKTAKPFAYAFLDHTYRQLYVNELSMGKIILALTGFAILIACLGLFGLAAFTAEQRTKEIGVRKVLGASVTNIVRLLSVDFLKLVLISIGIATPIAGYVMKNWLQDFAYKVELSWWVFALAGSLAVIIAFLTVSFQSVKAALMNPVTSLRSE
ncbi:ABC transporter permease [Larkinella humicola]|uniref:FtsX-like permease family protein n=1 Tax=Larkinella humicola TaxID=2607654 RepID=A0A5N1JIV4_9BACT|nr:ABC transporter permease [Larkinella humicola]KAA9354730.1 FtsX-like permease family protein [Larkinella humicola]